MTESTHFRTCNLCEAMCGLEIRHQDGRVLSIKGDDNDPLSRGHICPKAVALQDLHTDPDRLRRPVRRNGDDWEEISWEEAFDIVANRLRESQQRYGNDSVGVYIGNPTAHNHGALLMMLPFLAALNTRNRYSATSLDQLPQMVALLEMLGNQALFPIPDLDRTDYFLIMGTNPVASNGSIMTAPDIRRRIRDIQARGGKVVVVDPRRTETAALADAHHFIRPGTDCWLLLGMLHCLFRDGADNLRHLADFTDGLEALRDIARDCPPERAAELTGMAAETIEALAADMAAAPSAVAYGRVGISSAVNSSLSSWLLYAFNIVNGNFDREGGLMFTQPALDIPALAQIGGETGGFDRWRSRVKGLPEFGGELPTVTLADEILTEGEGQIRCMVTHAGNPVLSCPDGRRLDKAFSGLDFMVSIDLYINETTRHADIILPPTGHLEHAQFDPLFHLVAVRNTIKFSPALFAPPADSRHDWQILLELNTRLNARDRGTSIAAGLVRRVLMQLGDEGLIDIALRLGSYGRGALLADRFNRLLAGLPVYGGVWKGVRDRVLTQLRTQPILRAALEVGSHRGNGKAGNGLTLRKVKAAVHGIDLGPLQPCLPARLITGSGRIALVPPRYAQALAAVAAQQVPAESGELVLIGRRHIRSNNSWMHNSQRLVKGKPRCDVMIHPDDAKRLGIREGEPVLLSSRVGSIEMPAHLTEDIMPGVVSAPHGWGHDRKGVRLSVARQRPGVSINDVIDPAIHDPMTGMAVLNGMPVQVAAAAQRKSA